MNFSVLPYFVFKMHGSIGGLLEEGRTVWQLGWGQPELSADGKTQEVVLPFWSKYTGVVLRELPIK